MASKNPTTVKTNRATGKKGNLIVITGPSGVGKGTVVEKLLAKVGKLKRSVSATTREQRPAEVDGIDYFFMQEAEFTKLIKEEHFLEWAEFAGSHYGTPAKWVEENLNEGNDVLLEIEVQGAKQIGERCPQAILVFLSPPSFEALEIRLKGRNTESPEKIALRLSKAKGELEQKHLFDYEVVNDNLTEAVNNLIHIVYAERCRIESSVE
jgi:guanylate kinase